jgi:hypothetical protein
MGAVSLLETDIKWWSFTGKRGSSKEKT